MGHYLSEMIFPEPAYIPKKKKVKKIKLELSLEDAKWIVNSALSAIENSWGGDMPKMIALHTKLMKQIDKQSQ